MPHKGGRMPHKGGRIPPTQFLLMVAMHDYYYCNSPLQHKNKVPAEGATH